MAAVLEVFADLIDQGLVYRQLKPVHWSIENRTAGSGSAAGSGSSTYTNTVESPSGTPLAGADVWVTTDIAGINLAAGTVVTDAFGSFTFMLDPGTYYVWVQKSGHNFTNPTAITVS